MNIIPALSCFLPNKIDEISNVDENPVYDGSISPNQLVTSHDVKLNIIAQTGSDLLINGSNTGIIGPFPVPGNSDWEIYSYLNAKGTLTITNQNNKAITAGIAGGSGPIGYGGYFAGFSSIPAITKTGDCAKGQLLQVDDIYDRYEWLYSLDNVNWNVLSGATTHSINPGTQFGFYKCIVTKFSCLPAKETKEFKYLKCTTLNSLTLPEIGHCGSISVIKPVFTINPLLPIDQTIISQQPSSGKAYVDADGNIHFDAENTRETQVTFKYYFEGFGTFPDSEEVTVTVKIAQITLENIETTECLDKDGFGEYNLKEFELNTTNSIYTKFEYYEDSGLSEKIPDAKIENYKSVPGKTVFVKVFNSYNCPSLKPGEIRLKTFELPEIEIEINKQIVTLKAIGGNPPYQFSIKGNNYFEQSGTTLQNSYTFHNVPFGQNTASVISAENCLPTEQIFTVIRLLNVITPNDDGYNDALNYSDLLYKEEVSLKIFDRHGAVLFTGDKSNNFTWDGKVNGRSISTATYWYIVQWRDPGAKTLTQHSGWVLVKNKANE